MSRITAETAQRYAREFFDYELSNEAAATAAHIAGANAHNLGRFDLGRLRGLQPPVGYVNLMAQAESVRNRLR